MNQSTGLRSRRAIRFVAAGLIVIAMLYRVWATNGDMMFDPVVYAQNAFNVLQGTFTLATDSWFAHRLPVFVPVVPYYAVLGVGTWSTKLWPLVAALGQLWLIWLLGRRLLGPKSALIALAIAAVAPLDVVYASVLNPDIVISAFMTASVATWILAYPEGSPSGATWILAHSEGSPSVAARNLANIDGRPRRGLILLSGACWALAMTTREFAIVLAPFFLGWLVWSRRPRSYFLLVVPWFAVGLACVFVPLAAAYLWQTGDLFYRLGVVSGRYGEGTKSEGSQFLYYPWLMLHPRHAITGLMPHLSVLALLFAIVRPTRSRALLLLWALPIVLYLQFGSMSVSEYIPILKRERFLMPLTAPCALLAASAAPEITRWMGSTRSWVQIMIPAALVLFAIAGLLVVQEQRADGAERAAAFASVVRTTSTEPTLPVLFDHWRTGYRFSYFYGFREGADFYRGGVDSDRTRHPGAFGDSRLGYLSWYPREDDLPVCYVVLDSTVLREVRAGDSVTQTYRRGEIPGYAYDVPADWIPLGTFGTFRVYRAVQAAEVREP